MKQQIALVTGASRGIGKAIAQRLASDGYQVIGTATSQAGADAIGEILQPFGGLGRVLDVAQPEQIEALFSDLDSTFGAVQILVNNAGITQDNLLMRLDDTAWQNVIDVNLNSVYRLSKRAVKGMMKARNGRIINITSVIAEMGNAGQTNYAASKAGVEGFSRALAREIGSRNITVNCVAPGFIETDMTEQLGDDLVKKMLDNIPLGRLGKSDDVAAAVSFLASEDAGYITGTVLAVNGGMAM